MPRSLHLAGADTIRMTSGAGERCHVETIALVADGVTMCGKFHQTETRTVRVTFGTGLIRDWIHYSISVHTHVAFSCSSFGTVETVRRAGFTSEAGCQAVAWDALVTLCRAMVGTAPQTIVTTFLTGVCGGI